MWIANFWHPREYICKGHPHLLSYLIPPKETICVDLPMVMKQIYQILGDSTLQRQAKKYLINGIHLVSEDIMRMSFSNLPVICKEITHITCFIGMEDGTYAHPLLPSSYPFLVKTHLVKFALENFFHLKYLCMRGSFTHVSLLNSLRDAGFSAMENPFKIVLRGSHETKCTTIFYRDAVEPFVTPESLALVELPPVLTRAFLGCMLHFFLLPHIC
jgi:hypothetical protein